MEASHVRLTNQACFDGRACSDVADFKLLPGLAHERKLSFTNPNSSEPLSSHHPLHQINWQQINGSHFLNFKDSLASLQNPGNLPSLNDCISVLQICRKAKNLAHAKRVHLHMCEHGLEAHAALGNYLVPIYVDCDSMLHAHMAFNKLVHRNEHSWTSLIQGYIDCGKIHHALIISQHMQEDCVHPGAHTFVALLKACAKLKLVEQGHDLHRHITTHGLEHDRFVSNSLVDMYAKSGSLMEAQQVFDKLPFQNIISWNALVGGYVEHGFSEVALKCFEHMKLEGVSPSEVTFVCVLRACGRMGANEQGRETHAEVAKVGLEDNYFIGNILVDMYAKCGCLAEASEVCKNLCVRDVISWTALIAGYAEHGLGEEAFNCFQQMQVEGVSPELVSWNAVILSYAEKQGKKSFILYFSMLERGVLPDNVTFLSISKACSSTAALEIGRNIHAQLYKTIGLELLLTNALIDVYGKCGSMAEAQQTFDAMPRKVFETWNALITGYAQQGKNETVFGLFDRMEQEGMRPDEVTFVNILSVCSHAGLLGEGQKYFKVMTEKYGIAPNIKHYTCMVDLFGRAGLFSEVMVLLKRLPFQPDFVMWISVLSACCRWGNVEIGRQAFECLVRLNARHAASYILMSHIYMDASMWEDAKKIKAMRVHALASKEPGRSWIEIGGIMHMFVVGVSTHTQRQDLYAKLYSVYVIMKERYGPDFQHISWEDPVKEKFFQNTETLAIACGLLNTPEGTPIHVVKSLMLSAGTHAVMGLISKLEQRTIVCRDASHMHVFRDGRCSCEDYH